jgi:phospholipid/cholesterol/gamma-HCH transport system permease protein
MVLAVQTVMQFKAINMVNRMGTVVNMSVLRELGPVLAGVTLAGRVGGGLTAELGTMRVTEQIDALRAMAADPIRTLVVPRVLACIVIVPMMAIYANVMGVLGGYGVSVLVYGVNGPAFWRHAVQAVGAYDVIYGLIKCVFFGLAMGLIACFKGFRCEAGAAGVGRACTQGFVASVMAILTLDFFVGMAVDSIYVMLFGYRRVL